MSAYTTRVLADRRKRSRSDAIGLRVGICLSFLISAVFFGWLCLFCLDNADAIAERTRDTPHMIATLGIWSGVVAFCCLVLVPLFAAGIHEKR